MSIAELTSPKTPLTMAEKRTMVREKFADLAREADTLTDEEIESAHKALLKMEIERLVKKMGADAERDYREGKLDSADLEKSIKEHRARHPYR